MFKYLKRHPFGIQAHFDYSVVLSYAISGKNVEHLLPPFLTLDLWKDEFAFFTVALVKVKGLRPKGFPSFMGRDFHLVGHRLFVQYVNEKGKRLRGLYILKSQTDKESMVKVGNMLTHYRYEKINLQSIDSGAEIRICKDENELIRVGRGDENTSLPKDSVFSNWKEARRFAGPLPFTFSALPEENKVLLVQGVRSHWEPTPLEVKELTLDLSAYPFLKDARLSNAFIVENVPYHWNKGKIEKWKK